MPSFQGLLNRHTDEHRAAVPSDVKQQSSRSVRKRRRKPTESPLLWDSALSIEEQLRIEVVEMSKYAMASGLAIPTPVCSFLADHQELLQDSLDGSREHDLKLKGDDVARLFEIHQALALVIAPATPGTLRILAKEERRIQFLRFLGPIPLVHHMLLVAVLGLSAFIGLSLLPSVDANTDISELSTMNGTELLFNQLFFLAAAAVGASFEALFRANRFIVNGTYDPKYQPSYWIRFILGLIAGLVLALLLPIGTETTQTVTRPLLALIGGFSSPIVYRILTRLVAVVESLFGGDPEPNSPSRVQAEQDRTGQLQQQLALIRGQRNSAGTNTFVTDTRSITDGEPTDSR